ncbi:MAG: sensor histidine kinase [Lysobacteraceae bacterium]
MPDSPRPSPEALQHELAEARATIEALRQEQAIFAHGISHDLRAPLRSIDSFVALLARHGGLDDTARGYLERVRDASARAGSLIDALLDLSRATRAELAPATVDLSLLAEWRLAELQEADPAPPAELEVAPGLLAHGDERLLRQLLGALLDNAWKFSLPTGRVRIRVHGGRAGDRLRVDVRDEGVGFDMRYADKLFAPFQRLHGPGEGGGHGIGLALAQRIAARHGGHLHAESQPGAGATFHLDLPAPDAGDSSP